MHAHKGSQNGKDNSAAPLVNSAAPLVNGAVWASNPKNADVSRGALPRLASVLDFGPHERAGDPPTDKGMLLGYYTRAHNAIPRQ